MSVATVGSTIRARVNTLVTQGQSLPTQFDNQDFDRPTTKKWVRATIRFGESTSASFGGDPNRNRTVGILFLQLFWPTGVGDGDALTAANLIRANFINVTVSGVVFRVPSIRPIGADDGQYIINVECPFFYDKIE